MGHFDHATRQQVRDLFARFYRDYEGPSTTTDTGRTGKEVHGHVGASGARAAAALDRQAELFADVVPVRTFTMAMVQGFLMRYDTSAEALAAARRQGGDLTCSEMRLVRMGSEE